ncbi:MAG: ABC transporter permease [Actinobacteria bacterium]|nr:ABC transporter permease [Actinomycetota bacterium]
MRRFDYYFRETATGLRRNGIVAFAAMSTAFIALFLFGLALLVAREFDLVIYNITRNVQVAVYLTDPVRPDTVTGLMQKLEALPAVADVTYETKQQACDRFHALFVNQPIFTENVSCDAIPASLRVRLTDTGLFDQIPVALSCSNQEQPGGGAKLVCTEPGVETVADYSSLLSRLTAITRALSIGILFVAVVMLASAIALIANTLRMGMFARRREIGIMRLVGATNWRIRVPFLIEGLVESLLGAFAAVVFLFIVKVFFIDRLRGEIQFFPLIRNSDVLAVAPLIIIASVVVAVVAGTIGMRRFLDV